MHLMGSVQKHVHLGLELLSQRRDDTSSCTKAERV